MRAENKKTFEVFSEFHEVLRAAQQEVPYALIWISAEGHPEVITNMDSFGFHAVLAGMVAELTSQMASPDEASPDDSDSPAKKDNLN